MTFQQAESERFVRRSLPCSRILLANPAQAAEIPMHQIPAVVAELTSEQAALLAILGMLTTRLLVHQSPATDASSDRLPTADEARGRTIRTKRQPR